MKYNINREVKKMGSGGMFATFTPYIPDSGNPAPKQAAASPEKGESILDEEIMKELIKAGGLITDTNHLTTELAMLELSPLAYTSKGNRSQVMKLLAKVNELKVNKEMYSEAVKLAQSNGALNEVAIGNYGELFVKEKDGNIKAISTSDYLKSGGKKKVLTMSELMNERQYNPKLAWNSSIFSVANSSIGSEKIFSTIKGMIAAFGSESSEKTSWASTADLKGQLGEELKNKPTKSEMASLQKLAEIANSPGSYVEIKNTIKTERNHLDKGLSYIWGSLSKPAQAKLSVIASMNGKTPKDLITEMMISQTDYEESSSYTPHAKISGESSESKDDGKPLTAFELENNGKLPSQILNWNGEGITTKLVGNRVNLYENLNTNKLLQISSLSSLLGSHSGALLNKEKIFFGNNQVGLQEQNNLIIDSNKGAARVYMPVDSNGDPDFEAFKRIQELLKTAPKGDQDKMTKYFKDKGYNYIEFDNNFQIVENSIMKPFLLAYGYADENSPSTQGNSALKELTGNEKDGVENLFEKYYKDTKSEDPTGITNWWNTYYTGTVFIPYDKNASITAASMAGNLLNPRPTLEQARVASEVQSGRQVVANSNIFN